MLARELFQRADDAVKVLLVCEMDVHRGDDLEIVDEHHGLLSGLGYVAGDLRADVVQPRFVVALAEIEVLCIGGVARLRQLQMREILRTVARPAPAV